MKHWSQVLSVRGTILLCLCSEVLAAVTMRNNDTYSPFRNLPDPEWYQSELQTRRQRTRERRQKFRELFRHPNPQQELVEIPPAEWEGMLRDSKNPEESHRRISWMSGSGTATGESLSTAALADPGQSYDKWAQAYRMLGGFIDCDHQKQQKNNDHKNENNKNQNQQQQSNGYACSRWMLWAAVRTTLCVSLLYRYHTNVLTIVSIFQYVNPNYQGNEYDEYFGDNPTSVLDCHAQDTEWQLLGVYRQEFYQYIEQISKHLWAIDDYEYVVALAGLSYMTKYECFEVGTANDGSTIYASVAPKPYAKFEMALYSDPYCLTPNDSLGKTYDDFGLTTDIYLGSKDQTDDDGKSWAYDWWHDTQEYTLTSLNDVYEEFKYCTSCVDYPTYQDGYFIGNYGTDDDDLINQCWKFYSHNSYTCEADCIAMAHAQGTILSITYGDATFGKSMSGYSRSSSSAAATASSKLGVESPLARLLANAFLTLSFLLFVATFLAFAVARRSRYRESRSSRSRRLLDDEEKSRKSRRSIRSSRGTDGDGVYRTASRAKSTSKSRKSRSKSRTKSLPRRSRSFEAKDRKEDRGDDYY
jgi:hypothetical protein